MSTILDHYIHVYMQVLLGMECCYITYQYNVNYVILNSCPSYISYNNFSINYKL